EDEGEFVGSYDPVLAALYPPSDDPDPLAELARSWDAGPQSVGGDRDSLRLHPEDEQLVRGVAAANPRTVVVVVAGAAGTVEAGGVLLRERGGGGRARRAARRPGARRPAAVRGPARRGRPAAVRPDRDG